MAARYWNRSSLSLVFLPGDMNPARLMTLRGETNSTACIPVGVFIRTGLPVGVWLPLCLVGVLKRMSLLDLTLVGVLKRMSVFDMVNPPPLSTTGDKARIFRKLIAGDLKGDAATEDEPRVGVVAITSRVRDPMVGVLKTASRVLEGIVGVLKRASPWVRDSLVGVVKIASRVLEDFVGVFNSSWVLLVESKDELAADDPDLFSPA